MSYSLTMHNVPVPEGKEMDFAWYSNDMSKKWYKVEFSLESLMKHASKGYVFMPCKREFYEDTNKFEFLSTDIIMIDVDDDLMKTDPYAISKKLSNICAGFFYTRSHGIKGNRYRLVFPLSKKIKDENLLRFAFNYIFSILESMDVPYDKKANKQLVPLRTGYKGYHINENYGFLQVESLESRYVTNSKKKKEEDNRSMKEKIDDNIKKSRSKEYNDYDFEDLKARAEAIGYVEDRDTWQSITYSIRAMVRDGHIDEIQAWELFMITTDHQDGDGRRKFWESTKNVTSTNPSTFFYHSNQAGYVGDFKQRKALRNHNGEGYSEIKEYEKYISIDDSIQWLSSNQKILLRSPTGSGKTHSFVTASKTLGDWSRRGGTMDLFLFTVPTRAIASQVSAEKNVMKITGGSSDYLKNRIREYVSVEKKSVFVCTYDMSVTLFDELSIEYPLAKITIMVDEVHQFTHNYGFRQDAIKRTYDLHKRVRTFIALSGTPEEVLKDIYDKTVYVKLKDENPPCEKWGAMYFKGKQDHGKSILLEYINKNSKLFKMLVFIQSTETIKWIYNNLTERGIPCAMIESKTKEENETYIELVKTSRFPDGVRVILTTSLLSDGVNINNEGNIDFECVLTTTSFSRMYNVDQARQCANRFRFPYRKFTVFMKEPNEELNSVYDFEYKYEKEYRIAEQVLDFINNEYQGTDLDEKKEFVEYIHDTYEKRIGLKLNEDDELYIDELQVRHNVSQDKENYYMKDGLGFLKALGIMMGKVKISNPINATDVLISEGHNSAKDEIELKEIEEERKERKLIKAIDIKEHFTKDVFDAMRMLDQGEYSRDLKLIVSEFSKNVLTEQVACIESLIGFMEFEDIKVVAVNVMSNGNALDFKKRIENLSNDVIYSEIAKTNKTKQIKRILDDNIGKEFDKESKDVLIDNILKKVNGSKKNVIKDILKYGYKTINLREGNERFQKWEKLNVDHVSSEFNFEPKNIVEFVINHASTTNNMQYELVEKMMKI